MALLAVLSPGPRLAGLPSKGETMWEDHGGPAHHVVDRQSHRLRQSALSTCAKDFASIVKYAQPR